MTTKQTSDARLVARKARKYIKSVTALKCGRLVRQENHCIVFKLDFQNDACLVEDTVERITAQVGASPESFRIHNGEQYTWNFDGHRIVILDDFDGIAEITLRPDPDFKTK